MPQRIYPSVVQEQSIDRVTHPFGTGLDQLNVSDADEFGDRADRRWSLVKFMSHVYWSRQKTDKIQDDT